MCSCLCFIYKRKVPIFYIFPMLNTDTLIERLRAEAGVERVADLGPVHQGRIGYAHCTVSTGIERWQGMYFVWVAVTHQKNRAGRSTRIVKWPYSRQSATDLDGVLTDFRALEQLASKPAQTDQRGWFARGFDKLIGRDPVSEHRLASPLAPESSHGPTVTATVVRMGGQLEVALVEHRPSGMGITAQFPLGACASLRQALRAHASHGTEVA